MVGLGGELRWGVMEVRARREWVGVEGEQGFGLRVSCDVRLRREVDGRRRGRVEGG